MSRLGNLYSVQCAGDVAGGIGNNAAVSGTIPTPGEGKAIFLKSAYFSYDTAPTAARVLSITAGAATVLSLAVTAAGVGPIPLGVRAPVDTAVTYTFPASGTADNNGRLWIYYSIVDVL